MHYEIIKLRKIFPALQTVELSKLRADRAAHTIANGTDHFDIFDYREPTLKAYIPDNSAEIDPKRKRASVLICPGGGYEFVSSREAEPVALHFLALGYNAFVLDYEVAPVRYPAALLQVSAAAVTIRVRAEEFNADPDKIAVFGFSAGGHLAASLGVFWNEPFIREALGIKEGTNRPNALVLSYPVITSGAFSHPGSLENLLGSDDSPEMLEKMSLESQVNKGVPPTFLWHTYEDGTVPVENSLLFAEALRKENIPFELHIYPRGGHGMSLCTPEVQGDGSSNPHCATWTNLCNEWLKLTFQF